MIKYTCVHCGKIFYNHKSRNSKFCCHKCSTEHNKGHKRGFLKGNIPWNKGMHNPFIISDKTKIKLSIANSGKNSYLWKGGITKLSFKIRNSKNNRDWRTAVFTRDCYTCQDCGDNKGGNLVAHHIKEFSKIISENSVQNFGDALLCNELWDINNGITLCNNCHKKRHPKLKIIGLGVSAVARKLVA